MTTATETKEQIPDSDEINRLVTDSVFSGYLPGAGGIILTKLKPDEKCPGFDLCDELVLVEQEHIWSAPARLLPLTSTMSVVQHYRQLEVFQSPQNW